jgi:hypothetical protein
MKPPQSFHHPQAGISAGNTTIARVETTVRHFGFDPSGGFVRTEQGPGSLNPPLGWRQPAEGPRQPYKVKSEAELRSELAAASEALSAGDQVLSRATQAFERAEVRRGKCEHALAALLDVDAALVAHAVDAAKCDVGRIDDVLPADLQQRLGERHAAEAAHNAACTAATLLRREMAEASAAHGEAVAKVDKLVIQLLGVAVADRMANEIVELKARIEQRRTCLMGFDRVATAARVPLGREVMNVLHGINVRPLNPDELAAWTDAIDALKADAMATVEIELPPLVLPRPPPTFTGSTVVHAVPMAAEELVAHGLSLNGDPDFQPETG